MRAYTLYKRYSYERARTVRNARAPPVGAQAYTPPALVEQHDAWAGRSSARRRAMRIRRRWKHNRAGARSSMQ